MPSTEYTVKILLQSKDETSKVARQASKGLGKLGEAAKIAAGMFTALKVAQRGLELVKLGAQSERAAGALDNLARAAGTSGAEITSSIIAASDNTVDRMTAMAAANKAMLLGVAQSPEQFARLAEYATKLGRAMGQDANKSINDFVIAAGRQSRMIADNLGLMVSAEAANETYAKALGKTADELTDNERKQAFLAEMLRQAEEKTRALGDASEDTATKLERLSASANTAKTIVGEELAVYLGELIDEMALLNPEIEDQETLWRRAGRAIVDYFDPYRAVRGELTESIFAHREQNEALREQAFGLALNNDAWEEYNAEMRQTQGIIPPLAQAFVEVGESAYNYGDSLDEIISTQAMAAGGAIEYGKRLKEQRQAMEAMSRFLIDASMDWTAYYSNVDKQAEAFDIKREQLEQQHIDELAELQKRGQAKAIHINAAAEEEKLNDLQERLAIALQQQAEFTGKTKESTKMAKDRSIAALEEQIAAQQQLLDAYYGGRLIKAGENVDALIEEEDRRHKEAVAGLEEEIEKTQQLQRQQMGTLMMQTFQDWAEMKDIPVEKMLEMRTAIGMEYGLISEEEAQLVARSVATWEEWALDFSKSAERVVEDLALEIETTRELQQALDDLPSEKVIDIIIRQRREGISAATVSPTNVPVLTQGETTTNNYSFNQTVNTRASTHNVMSDFKMAQSLAQ